MRPITQLTPVAATPEAWSASAKHLAKTAFEGPTVPIVRDMLMTLNAYSPFKRDVADGPSILDLGCGPGQVIGRLISEFAAELPAGTTLVAGDVSPGMLKELDKRRGEEIAALDVEIDVEGDGAEQQEQREMARHKRGLWDTLSLRHLDAHAMPSLQDGSVTHVTAGLVYFMLSDPHAALVETYRVLSHGGVLALSSFGRVSWMEMIGLFAEVRPGIQFPSAPLAWASMEGVKVEMQRAGLVGVRVHEVQTYLEFEDSWALVELLVLYVPSVVSIVGVLSEEERRRGMELMVQFLDREYSTCPRRMPATALVGVGRKA